jgi:hypothetical protein
VLAGRLDFPEDNDLLDKWVVAKRKKIIIYILMYDSLRKKGNEANNILKYEDNLLRLNNFLIRKKKDVSLYYYSCLCGHQPF